MSKRVLSSAQTFKAARAIEENVDELRELSTNFERAEAIAKIVGFDVSVANFVNAAACVDENLFPKTKQATLRDQVKFLSAEVQALRTRIDVLEKTAASEVPVLDVSEVPHIDVSRSDEAAE